MNRSVKEIKEWINPDSEISDSEKFDIMIELLTDIRELLKNK